MNPVSRRPPSQHGNTLIGIIIGLVIGLSIAVVVALAITKGSMPFTDKQGKAGKAAVAAGNQTIDPNRPLYGNGSKGAARSPAKEARQAPADDPLAQVIATFKPDPVPAAPVQESKAVPVDKKPAAAAPVPALAAKTGAADEKWIYYLQAGAFREASDAEGARAKLALLGFEATISDRSTESGVLHRVRMGPFNQVEAMNRVRGKLSENGVDVAVIRNQK
jgi:cell division protein FtsN